MSSRQAASHLPPALPLWSLQGLGSLDLVTPVLKVTHSFHHSVMERMKEKVSKVKINCKAPIWEANPWSIPVLPKQKLVWTTKWPPANGMAPVHAFSHCYNEVFTVCIFPTSFHTATTQVWIYKDVLWGALKKKAALESIHSVHLCKCRQNGKLILPVWHHCSILYFLEMGYLFIFHLLKTEKRCQPIWEILSSNPPCCLIC